MGKRSTESGNEEYRSLVDKWDGEGDNEGPGSERVPITAKAGCTLKTAYMKDLADHKEKSL